MKLVMISLNNLKCLWHYEVIKNRKFALLPYLHMNLFHIDELFVLTETIYIKID